MRIFITGGTGFIGKHLVQKLDSEKNNVLLLTRNPSYEESSVKFLKGSFENIFEWKNKMKKFQPEAAVHLAWEGIPDYGFKTSIRNLKYGLELFQLLSDAGCRTILASGSVWEYGKVSGKLSEDLAVKPYNSFTAAKNSLNWIGREIARENGINFIWTRLFYVYGPGQKESSLIPYLIRCVKTDEKPQIRNPAARNDFIYVEDVANAISRLLLTYKGSGAFNIGSGDLTSVKTVLNKIYALFSKKPGFQSANQTEMDTLSSACADITKIRKATGWLPAINIDDGLKKTFDSFI